VRYCNLVFMCFAVNALVGSQLSRCTQTSLPRDQVVRNPLSLYTSYLALQAQHAPSTHDETIISTLKNIQDDKPVEKEEQPLPSLFDSRTPQPPEVGMDIEIEPVPSDTEANLASQLGNHGPRAGRSSCLTRSGPTRPRMRILALPAAGPAGDRWPRAGRWS
jgi:hypothetical protein